MNLLQADIQLASARHLKWMHNRIAIADGEITVEGGAGNQDVVLLRQPAD